MKKILYLFLFFLCYFQAEAQVPQRFNYQAVVRDNAGLIVPNQIVSIQLGILESSVNGQVKYIENHLIVSNQFGLVKLEVGGGTPINGDWASIDWADHSHFLRVSIDLNGGNNFQFLGTSQLLTVPYALVSERARIDNVDDADSDPNNEIQSLSINDGNLSISGANSVTLPDGLIDEDNQTLSIAGNQLSISGGNSVNLTDNVNDADADPTNEIQQLNLNGNTLELSQSGGAIDLSAVTNNTDNQTLSISGNTLSISGGNSVFIPSNSGGGGGEDDQNLVISNDSLFIEDGNGIDLSPYMDNTDNQILQITGDFLTIQNGNLS